MLIFSVNVNASNLMQFIFNSAIETDRYQSQHWHFATKENPYEFEKIIKINGCISKIPKEAYEGNPLVAGTTDEEFNRRVNFAKEYVNYLPQKIKNKTSSKIIYSVITIVEVYNVYRNNKLSQEKGLPQYIVLDLVNYKF
mgnify:CR=1 FL=1